MISKFDISHAGHVNYRDLGFDAKPLNHRPLPDGRINTVFDKSNSNSSTKK